MLSSSSSHILLSLLNQAIHSCKEEEKQLEEKLMHYRKLLGDWLKRLVKTNQFGMRKTDSCEAFNQDESETEPQGATGIQHYDGWMDREMKGYTDRQAEEWDGQTGGGMGRTDRRRNGTDRQVEEWDGQTSGTGTQVDVVNGHQHKGFSEAAEFPEKTQPDPLHQTYAAFESGSCKGVLMSSQKEEIIRQAWRHGSSDFDGATIRIMPDLSRHTLRMRRLVRPLLDQIRSASATYRWGHPFHLIIYYKRWKEVLFLNSVLCIFLLESQPSPLEVKEVELLNKALEKALKVRGSARTESPKTHPSTQAIPAYITTQEKPVKPLQKLVYTGTKPKTYQVKPPYKTMPEKRRDRGSTRPPSTANTVKPPSLGPLTSEKGNGGKDRPASTANTAKSPPLRPLTSEIGKDRSAESKEVPSRTDSTPGNLQPSSVLKMEYVSSTLTATDVKASKQDQRQQKALTLKDIGSTLKLPIKYRQLYKKNSRLWEKYFEMGARVPASRPSFIQQLQTTFVAESPELSLFEMEEETARLQRGVRCLEEYIDTAKTWRGSGPAHWQHYRTLLMLEAMQDEVAKSYCELQKLGLVADQYKKWCEKLSVDIDCSEVAGCPFEFCTMPSVLVYSHPDELRELTATHLRLRELQQKIYLQKVLSEELLAEADSQCRSASPSYMLLRAIYTQLCEGGETFPVLVLDDS
ncbi:PREDICTED: uncharacterized protein C16orf59 homolog [Nanorana parkeri]|uniref:uncharacterized protein C16orf59 homolog n=1 Tax=Nanorana parkeri TaxID=125878 RepID=UPI000854F28E|nr:PREDICTED: uncharacterized protein C16orf59 homolog [Nanorana parkeri]